MTVTRAQMRAARASLGWTRIRLGRAAKVSPTTVYNIEHEDLRLSEWAQRAIQQALESAGVVFIEENGEGPGVRLKKTK